MACVLAASSPLITGALQKKMPGKDAASFSDRAALLWKSSGLAIALCAFAVTALAWAPASPATVFHRSAMIVALRAYLDAGPVEGGKPGNLRVKCRHCDPPARRALSGTGACPAASARRQLLGQSAGI